MSAAPVIKGWCPGALTPMMSGDGLVVRVRPFNGVLSGLQANGLADLSARFGNGIMDLSSRANVQLRGVTTQNHPALLEGLRDLKLLDNSAEVEARRNVLVTPFWQVGDETAEFAKALTQALQAANAPQVPHKFGFAIDCGAIPVLQPASADIRLERGHSGRLIVVAGDMPTGKPVSKDTAIDEMIALAAWFLQTRRDETRMKKLLATDVALPSGFDSPRQKQSYLPQPGKTPGGHLVALAFGQMRAETLAELAEYAPLRLTPWRMLLAQSAAQMPPIKGLITDRGDVLLRVVACTGAPGCVQAQIKTRPLARELAPHIPVGNVAHISGCAKGCAHPKPADLTITGAANGLNLIRNGRASDTPSQSGLSVDQLCKAI